MNRFEAQKSHTQNFVHMIFIKEISPIYKIVLNIFYYLQTLFCIVYQVLIKSILKNYQDLQNIFKKCCFWPIAVDRAVDRLCFRSERSTRLLTVWVRACVRVSRSTGRLTGPHFGRPTFGRLKAPMFLFVTVDRGLATVKFFENRSTVSLISAQTASFLNTF